jgi:anion-transporting  ArsA/GET3 family ATPase
MNEQLNEAMPKPTPAPTSAPRLTIVSGKGGVGRSLVAAALASRLADAGARTLLIAHDDGATAHPAFDIALRYEPQAVGHNLDASRVDAERALAEYLKKSTPFAFFYQGVLANPAVRRMFDALPLFDELFCLGKLYDLVCGDKPYERVVFDAPATGHCRIMLNVPRVAVATLAGGPVLTNATRIRTMLEDPGLTELRIVTLAEATPVREALELHAFAQGIGISSSRVIVNRTVTASVGESELERIDRFALVCPDALPLARAARLERSIAVEQAGHIRELEAAGLVVERLPELATDPTHAFAELAARLGTQT